MDQLSRRSWCVIVGTEVLATGIGYESAKTLADQYRDQGKNAEPRPMSVAQELMKKAGK